MFSASPSLPLSAFPTAVFSCSVERIHGRVTLGVIGEIDRTSAGQFRTQLLTLAKEHPAALAIDMSNVALPDDSGLAVLVETWRFAVEHGIVMSIASPSESVSQAFDVAPSGELLTLRA